MTVASTNRFRTTGPSSITIRAREVHTGDKPTATMLFVAAA
jgi:hypothetical protein